MLLIEIGIGLIILGIVCYALSIFIDRMDKLEKEIERLNDELNDVRDDIDD